VRRGNGMRVYKSVKNGYTGSYYCVLNVGEVEPPGYRVLNVEMFGRDIMDKLDKLEVGDTLPMYTDYTVKGATPDYYMKRVT